jgi:hypothetical protein
MIDGKTLEQWNSEIDAYEIYDVWREVLTRLYPNQFYDNKNLDNSNTPQVYYQNIDVYQLVDDDKVFASKFPYEIYVQEQDAYKLQLKDDIAQRFADLQIREDIEAELDGVELNVAIAELGLNEPNAAAYKVRLLDNKDLAQAQALRAAYDTWRANQDIIDAEDQAIADGVRAIEKGKKVVAYINYLNRQKGLSLAQFQQILEDQELQLIERLCLNGSLVSARFQISQYTPDGVIMLQEDKDKILAFMDR